MSAQTVQGDRIRLAMTYGGEHPDWCAREWSCTGDGHPADMSHSSDPRACTLPLSLHSPFASAAAWCSTTLDVRAWQPIPGQARVLVHAYGSQRVGEVDLDSIEDSDTDLDRWHLDAELALTSVEARELAEHLLMVADAIDSGTRVGGAVPTQSA